MKTISLNLLFFSVVIKNLKTKVKEIQFLSRRVLYSVSVQFLSRRVLYSVSVILFIRHIWLHGLMIKISENVETNPGPNQKHDQSLPICHRNLQSIPAHKSQKL